MEAVPLHDVDDVNAFASAIVQTVVRGNGSFLRPDQREEAVDFLVVEVYEIAAGYDAALTSSFRLYARWILKARMVDWYRKSLGDSRAKTPRHTDVSLSHLPPADEPTYTFEEEVLDREVLA